ncbi:hypothetical protein RvY_12447-2 [Ramazzottius varieornatus]|nr:hypothetical protein RvY_12447-2 [Ramazzottius varieornatus]
MGTGSFGSSEVFKTERGNMKGEIRAIKRIEHTHQPHDSRLRQTRHEINVFSTLSDSGITLSSQSVVQFYSYASVTEGTLLCLEFCAGRTLLDLYDQSEIPLALLSIREIARQLATALSFLHTHFILHLDVRLSNILLAQPCQINHVEASPKNSGRVLFQVVSQPQIRLTGFRYCRLYKGVQLPVQVSDGLPPASMAHAAPEVNLCPYSSESGDLGGLPVSDTWCLGSTLASLYLTDNIFEPDNDIETEVETETPNDSSETTPSEEPALNSQHAFDLYQQLNKTQWILNQHIQYKPLKSAMDECLDIARTATTFTDRHFVTDSDRLATQHRPLDDVDLEVYPHEGKAFTDLFFDLIQNMFQYNPHLRKDVSELLSKHPFFTTRPEEMPGNNPGNSAKRRKR